MIDDKFPYDEWVANALRGVLRQTLREFQANGSLGEHHLYINLKTDGEDVRIPDFLKAQYPEEITIVLQHQFTDLDIRENSFEVTLSFGGQNHRLFIPFDSVTYFADPSVNFGVQIGFEVDDAGTATENTNFYPNGKVITTKDLEQNTPAPNSENAPAMIPEELQNNASDEDIDTKNSGAEVINIEAFRNK